MTIDEAGCCFRNTLQHCKGNLLLGVPAYVGKPFEETSFRLILKQPKVKEIKETNEMGISFAQSRQSIITGLKFLGFVNGQPHHCTSFRLIKK